MTRDTKKHADAGIWGVAVGCVEDVFAGHNVYHVRVGGTTRRCVAVPQSSLIPGWSAHELAYYPPTSLVLVALIPTEPVGYILGSVPTLSDHPVFDTPPTLVGHAHGVDTENSLVHTAARTALTGGVHQYGSGRSREAVPGMDQGVLNDLGVGYGITKLAAWLRASDMAGVEAFAEDSLLRLRGMGLETWTGMREELERVAGGRGIRYAMRSFSYGRALGVFSGQPDEALVQRQGGGIFKAGQLQNRFEPERGFTQAMVPDALDLDTAAGASRFILAPPANPAEPVNTRENRTDMPRVLSEFHQTASGITVLRSAQAIVIEKYAFKPGPKLVDVTEAERTQPGNTLPAWEYPGEAGVGPAAAVHDYVAYVTAWLIAGGAAAVQALVGTESREDPAAYTDLPLPGNGAAFLPPPKFTTYQPDPSLPSFRYYQSKAGIYLLEDGSVHIEDAYGAYLRLARGNLYASAPLDTFILPGRSAVVMAGKDAILKAGNSVDVVALHGDVRVKAERHAHVLAGNGGTVGSVALECRAKNPSFSMGEKPGEDQLGAGIILRAPDAPVLVRGSDVMAQADKGNLSLLAESGSLQTYAATVYRRGVRVIVDSVGSTVNTFTAQGSFFGADGQFRVKARACFIGGGQAVYLNGQLIVDGQAVVKGNALFGANIQVKENVVSEGSSVAKSHANLSGGAGRIKELPEVDIRESDWRPTIEKAIDTLDDNMPKTAGQVFKQGREALFGSSGLLNGDAWKTVRVTLRTPEQYGASDFVLYEGGWQKMYREAGKGFKLDETAVTGAGGVETLSYPGKGVSDRRGSFVMVDGKLFDWKTGRPTAQNTKLGALGEPQYPEPKVQSPVEKPGSLKDDYIVSVKVRS